MQPFQALRDTGSIISLGLPEPGERGERNESPLHRLDSSRESNATGPHVQQVDRPASASVRPSAKPSTSSPPLNRPSASMSPLPSLPIPALSKPTSNRVHTAHGTPPDGSQARPGGAPPELPHHRSEGRGKTPPDGQSQWHTSHSATPSRLPPPVDERAAAATESVSQSLPVSAPRSLDKSVSRREAKRATEGTTLDKKEKKGIALPEEYETAAEDFATGSDGAKRRNAGLNLSSRGGYSMVHTS